MVNNIGKIDKTIRVILGLLIIITGFFCKSWWGAIGLILLLTALMGISPLYLILGLNTRHVEKI